MKYSSINKLELKTLWEVNVDLMLRISGQECHHSELKSLHKQTWESYESVRS